MSKVGEMPYSNKRLKLAYEVCIRSWTKSVVPFGNIGLTCMPLSGNFMDIEDLILVHQTEPHGDKERYSVLIFTPSLPSIKLVK